MGSDHCPVKATFNLPPLYAPSQPPSLCVKYLSEFSGTQQTLHAFLQPTFKNDKSQFVVQKKKNKQTSLKDFFGSPESKVVKVDEQVQETGSLTEVWDLPTTKKEETVVQISESAHAWKAILGKPPPVPLCSRHKEKCVIKTSKKKGPNMNRQFYSCPRSGGPTSNPEASCNFFQWVRK